MKYPITHNQSSILPLKEGRKEGSALAQYRANQHLKTTPIQPSNPYYEGQIRVIHEHINLGRNTENQLTPEKLMAWAGSTVFVAGCALGVAACLFVIICFADTASNLLSHGHTRTEYTAQR